VCSDEPAHCQPSTCACYLGWTTSELLGELADARIAVSAPEIGASPVERGSCACSGALMLLVRWAMDQAWAAAAPAAMGISVHPDKGPTRNFEASGPCISAKVEMVVSPYRSKRIIRPAWVHATQPLP
jgi:hypothetical protein